MKLPRKKKKQLNKWMNNVKNISFSFTKTPLVQSKYSLYCLFRDIHFNQIK